MNSKAWRDFGFFKYRWESTGTTKSKDFEHTPYSNDSFFIDTAYDTLFNGGHLEFGYSHKNI